MREDVKRWSVAMKAVERVKQLTQDWLDRWTGAEQPKLYYKMTDESVACLASLSQLQQKYRPTPWLSNPHLHLLYFDLIKKKQIRFEYDRLDPLTMQDGGVTAIMWSGVNLPAHTPTIVLLHTITGSPDSMRELVRDLRQYTGWRVALCLRRGHAKLPMPVPKMSLFGSVEDLKAQIAYIQTQYPTSDLYAVGSSAGTGLLVRYLGEVAEDTPIKAAFALCPGYNTESSFQHVHPFYSKVMAKKLLKSYIYPYQHTWQQRNTALQKVLAVKTLADFERQYFELAGYDSYASYSQATNPMCVFEQVKIPVMVLNAEDDPICHIQNFEPYKEVIQNMPNIVVVTTKKGSHCGFYEGMGQTQSWASRLMSAYLQAQHTQQ